MTLLEKTIVELEKYEPYAEMLSNVTVLSDVFLNALKLLREQRDAIRGGNDDVQENETVQAADYGRRMP